MSILLCNDLRIVIIVRDGESFILDMEAMLELIIERKKLYVKCFFKHISGTQSLSCFIGFLKNLTKDKGFYLMCGRFKKGFLAGNEHEDCS